MTEPQNGIEALKKAIALLSELLQKAEEDPRPVALYVIAISENTENDKQELRTMGVSPGDLTSAVGLFCSDTAMANNLMRYAPEHFNTALDEAISYRSAPHSSILRLNPKPSDIN